MPTSAPVLLAFALLAQTPVVDPASSPAPAADQPPAAAPAPSPSQAVEPAPAAESLIAARRFTLAASAEVNLVGLCFGPRLELNWRPFEPGSASRVRLAIAFDYGPEFFYIPVALGYRAVYRQAHVVRPLVGVGVEAQQFVISDAPTISRLSGYLEGGVLFGFDEHWDAGAVLSLEYAPAFSPGLSARLQVSRTF